jgi:hypothetical protein
MDIYGYKQYVYKQLKEHAIDNKLETIERDINMGRTPENIEMIMNSIDRQMTRIVIKAEKTCSSKHHESEWSIELHRHSILCKYWLTARKGMNSGYQALFRTRELYKQLSTEQQEGVKKTLAIVADEQYVARESHRCIDYKKS